MSLAEPISFDEAVSRSVGKRRHLLLGNGFSIAVHRAFGYPKLYEKAVMSDPSLRRFFPDSNNPNFEEALGLTANSAEATQVRKALIRAVAAVHPKWSLSLTDEQRAYCREFLRKFVGRTLPNPGAVFTTNYDLLLHWVVSTQPKSEGAKRQTPLRIHDAFDGNGEWHKGVQTQTYYLHGAVHINEFIVKHEDGPRSTEMLRWRPGSRVKDQVDDLLRANRFPVFVAEATAADKAFVMRNYEYLRNAYKRFRGICSEPESALFTFGHSFGSSDNHISKCIGLGEIGTVYFGVFSKADRSRAAALADEWAEARPDGRQVNVIPYDASSCPVWHPISISS